MYKPAPPRPRKTDNIRSRTGCKGCRERRTKCDERKPTCGTCARLRRVCESMKPRFEFRVATIDTSSTLPPSKSRPTVSKRGKPSLPDTALVQSLQHTERDIFYTTYWEDRCMPALHPLFYTALQRYSDIPILKDAILALSSCNTSRSTAESKFPPSPTCGGAHRPSLIHQTRSQLYYSRAVAQFVSLSYQDCQRHLTIALTVLVLFSYIESSMGNFQAFDCHVQGFSIFLDALHQHSGDPFVKALLTAWMQPRFLVWWSQAYYSSLEAQRNLPSVRLPTILRSTLDSFSERRVSILAILSESHRLNVRAVLEHWSHGSRPEMKDMTSVRRKNSEEPYAALAAEAAKTDEWLRHLPQSEQPSFSSHNAQSNVSTFPSVVPRFESHDAALNYAYYVVARIMQCTSLLHHLPSQDAKWLGHECSDTEPWIQLLLQIAQGTDMKISLIRNSYTIGFSGLLLAASLRCQNAFLSKSIEHWLQKLEDLQPTEEGSFPIFQALSAVKAINRQRERGRDTFALSQQEFDAGGPKFSCYCSQPISSLLLHGKLRSTGELVTECVPVERQRR